MNLWLWRLRPMQFCKPLQNRCAWRHNNFMPVLSVDIYCRSFWLRFCWQQGMAHSWSHEWDTPSPQHHLCLPLAGTEVTTLADTGVSLSLVRGDVTWTVIWSQGWPFSLTKCTVPLVTLSGDQLNVEGSLEIAVLDIGVVTFVVIRNMAHEAILGWDQMLKHQWSVDTNNHVMWWGSRLFPMSEE